jgi:hypothetical protein
MKKFTPSELGNWLFKRQVEDDTLSQAISHCSLDGSPTDLELRKLLNQLDKYQDQVDDITSIGTHSISLFSSQ